MILMGFSIGNLALSVLCISLALLVLIIAYRKLLAYLGKGTPPKEKYCVLYSLEKSPAKGELEFYFTCEEAKEVHFEILDENLKTYKELASAEYDKGGHIILFDSTKIPNGTYYYQLRSENQKTMKRMFLEN